MSDGQELEKFDPSKESPTLHQQVEVELVRGVGAVNKLAYMITRGPGGPVFIVCVLILALLFKGKLTEMYFIGLIALGLFGAHSSTKRGRNGP